MTEDYVGDGKMRKSHSAIRISDCSLCIGTAVAKPEFVSNSGEMADSVRHQIVASFSSEK